MEEGGVGWRTGCSLVTSGTLECAKYDPDPLSTIFLCYTKEFKWNIPFSLFWLYQIILIVAHSLARNVPARAISEAMLAPYGCPREKL